MTDSPWATERTLLNMIEHLEKSLDKSNENFDKFMRELKGVATSSDVPSDKKDQAAKLANEYSKSLGKMTEDTGDANESMKRLVQALEESKDSVEDATSAWKKWTKFALTNIGIWGTIIGSIRKVGTTALDLEREGLAPLLRSQTGFSENVKALSVIADKTGLSFNTLMGIFESSGSAIGKYGFVNFANSAKDITEAFAGLAVTSEEATEHFANTIEQQRQSGVLEYFSRAASLRYAKETLRNTIEFSKALRTSREELEAASKAQEEKLDTKFVKLYLQKIFSKERAEDIMKSFDAVTKAFKDSPEMVDTVLSGINALATTGAAAASPKIIALYEAGQRETAEEMIRISNDAFAGIITDNATYFGQVADNFRNQDPMGMMIASVMDVVQDSKAQIGKVFGVATGQFGTTFYSKKIKDGADAAAFATSETIKSFERLKKELDLLITTIFGGTHAAGGYAAALDAATEWMREHRHGIKALSEVFGRWVETLGRVLKGEEMSETDPTKPLGLGGFFVKTVKDILVGIFDKDFWKKAFISVVTAIDDMGKVIAKAITDGFREINPFHQYSSPEAEKGAYATKYADTKVPGESYTYGSTGLEQIRDALASKKHKAKSAYWALTDQELHALMKRYAKTTTKMLPMGENKIETYSEEKVQQAGPSGGGTGTMIQSPQPDTLNKYLIESFQEALREMNRHLAEGNFHTKKIKENTEANSFGI